MFLLILPLLLGLLLGSCQVQAKAVFAHFMVGNTESFGVDDWKDDMNLAKASHIDAFALNIANNDSKNDPQLANAFAAANLVNFKLFFSFDYAGNGLWAKSDVSALLTKYSQNGAYYKYGSKPLVSTFEGPERAVDWKDLKTQFGVFFIPDWSSQGAKAALELENGVADGLFNWAAWPVGPTDMNTYVDASYRDYLNGKPYMMPVSPWFFTNMPGFKKNWVWRGDDLWYHRWEQVNFVQPEFVEIISWNDYGESHYIGPLKSTEYEAFGRGVAPYNYALDMPHDGWRQFLPFSIDMYKNNISSITNEGLVSWYRLSDGAACADGATKGDYAKTTGNSASHLELEYAPADIVQDRIFYSALLGSSGANVTVSIGGVTLSGPWQNIPYGGIGIYHGSISIKGMTGTVSVALKRGSTVIATMKGKDIGGGCQDGINNFNAWVGNASASGNIAAVSPRSLTDDTCIAGFGVFGFKDLCNFACKNGYCPIGACTCSLMGKQADLPPATGQPGYPVATLDDNYRGLCSFSCNYGHCPSDTCQSTDVPLPVSTVSPFLPATCTSGHAATGQDQFDDLCKFTCKHGFCPRNRCVCDTTGVLDNFPTDQPSYDGSPLQGYDDGLCKMACKFGTCPSDVCLGGPDVPTEEEEDRWKNMQHCTLFSPPKHDVSVAQCNSVCGDEVAKAVAAGNYSSVSCISFSADPIWDRYDSTTNITQGNCSCNNEFIDELAETFIEALPIIAEIGCKILMSAVDLVVNIGLAAVPGIGEAIDGGMIAGIEAAKLADYVYGAEEAGKEAFSDWLDPCGASDKYLPDDLDQVFDILGDVADALVPRGGYKNPKNVPTATNKPKPSKTDDPEPTACAANKRAACSKDPTQVTVITKSVAKITTITGVCSGSKYPQACYNYYSAIQNGHPSTFTCRDSNARVNGEATKIWSKSHAHSKWRQYTKSSYTFWDGDVKKPRCHRDEYPPGYFHPPSGNQAQVVRWIPGSQNEGAAQAWNSFCKDNDGGAGNGQLIGGVVNDKLVSLKKPGNKVVNGKTTTTQFEADFTRAVYEFSFDKLWPTQPNAANDWGLRDNPCWPKRIVPNDPGYVLLVDDPWYQTAPVLPAPDYRSDYSVSPDAQLVKAADALQGTWKAKRASSPIIEAVNPSLQVLQDGYAIRHANFTRRLTEQEVREEIEVIPCTDHKCTDEVRALGEEGHDFVVIPEEEPGLPFANVETVPTPTPRVIVEPVMRSFVTSEAPMETL